MSEQTGGGQVSKSVIDSVVEASNLLRYNTFSFKIRPYESYKSKFFYQLRGYSCGLTPSIITEVLDLISLNSIDVVFYNSSRYGRLMQKIKNKYPDIKNIVFSHNVEVKFFADAIKGSYNVKGLLSLWSSWLNEFKTVKISDVLISLNERDSLEQQKIYKRKADYICPLSLKDRYDETKKSIPSRIVGGFIGSNFWANKHGMQWFAENVSPYINYPILLIGKDFEKEFDFFSKFPNIQLIGTVDNLDEYYSRISFIVSPIFLGSGMKTKTAEAMMFGKTIFGTSEAFEGYDVDYIKIGGLCNSAQEFIDKINTFKKEDYYNEYSRFLYKEKYSESSIRGLFVNIFKSIS